MRGGHLRVGLVDGAPWVVRRGDGPKAEPEGVEVELIRSFAKELQATPDWVWGSEQQHMEALEHHELDLVAGGLTNESPWNGKVGMSSPFLEERIVVGAPRTATPPDDLKGQTVATPPGEATAALLKKKGAIPRESEDPWRGPGLVAAPEWQLAAWGLAPTKFELQTRKHVLAVPPGENGWLVRLDRFLHDQRPGVGGLLRQAAGEKQSSTEATQAKAGGKENRS